MKDGTVDEKGRQKFFNSVWTRVRGGLDSNKCFSLLKQIDHDIFKISQLTAITVEMEPLRINRSRILRSRSSRSVRDNAQSLFDNLHLRWSYPCPCQLPHRANLQLSKHGDNETNEPCDEDTPTCFALLFSFEKSSGVSTLPPWQWRDVEIKTLSRAQKPPETSVCSNIQPSAATTSRLKQPATETLQEATPASKIDDLCKVLMRQGLQSCYLGFLEDQQRQHQLFAVSGPGVQNDIVDETSLHYIVHGKNKIMLGPREKYAVLKEVFLKTNNISIGALSP